MTPEQEAKLGEAMRKHEWDDGHRGRLPINRPPPPDKQVYDRAAIIKLARRGLKSRQIAETLGYDMVESVSGIITSYRARGEL